MRNYLFTFLLLFAVQITFAQGVVYESLSFSSDLLGEEVKYSVYLPHDYDLSERKYPVLFLLHGYSDDETGWVQFGEVKQVADEAIGNKKATPMVIIMPDAKVTWYCNDHKMKTPWEDMFIKELIPFMEENYKIRTKKEFRAISGLSMGGYGALKIAMKHHTMFGSCVALSAAVYTDDQVINFGQKRFDGTFGFLFGEGLEGNNRLTEHWKNENPLHIVDTKELTDLNSVRFYIDCGDDDWLGDGNWELHKKMRTKGIKHEYRVRNGGHQWSYWRTGLADALEYITTRFHR